MHIPIYVTVVSDNKIEAITADNPIHFLFSEDLTQEAKQVFVNAIREEHVLFWDKNNKVIRVFEDRDAPVFEYREVVVYGS